MVALTTAFGFFHIAQQRIHFANREWTIGSYGAMARHRGQDSAYGLFNDPALPVLCKISTKNVSLVTNVTSATFRKSVAKKTARFR